MCSFYEAIFIVSALNTGNRGILITVTQIYEYIKFYPKIEKLNVSFVGNICYIDGYSFFWGEKFIGDQSLYLKKIQPVL